jgi:hypothetical protein
LRGLRSLFSAIFNHFSAKKWRFIETQHYLLNKKRHFESKWPNYSAKNTSNRSIYPASWKVSQICGFGATVRAPPFSFSPPAAPRAVQ